MAALDNPVVLSLLCRPRYLAVADTGRLELVSRRVRHFARRCQQRLTRMCVKQVVETCTKPEEFLATLADRFGNLTMVVHVDPEWLVSLAQLPRLSAMHLRGMKMSGDLLALLNKMTGLRTLIVSVVIGDRSLDVAQLCAEAQPPIKLNLNHLSIQQCNDLSFLTACRLELLCHLIIFLPEGYQHSSHLEEACQQLRQCVSLTVLEVVNTLLRRPQLQPLLSVVAALPGLLHFRLRGQVELLSWQGFWQICDDERICRSLSRLKLWEWDGVEAQLARRKFPNLHNVEVFGHVACPERIFETQPKLESLKYSSETVRGATKLGVAVCWLQSLMTRLV